MLDPSEARAYLNVTRQGVAKAVASGRMFGLPAGRSRRSPMWQFSFAEHVSIRPEVAGVLAAFRNVYPSFRPSQVASWAVTRQPELDDLPPARSLEDAGKLEPSSSRPGELLLPGPSEGSELDGDFP